MMRRRPSTTCVSLSNVCSCVFPRALAVILRAVLCAFFEDRLKAASTASIST